MANHISGSPRPQTTWAPYSDALKLILTGSISETLTSDQKTIYLSMLDQGMVDKRGRRRKKRTLPSISTRKYVTNTATGEQETYYYIPDLFKFMLTVFQEWSIFNPPVDLDFLNSLEDAAGKPLFMYSNAPGHKKWEASKSGERHWELLTNKIEIQREITELQKTHHGNDPLKLEAQKRMFKSLSAKLERLNQRIQKYETTGKDRAKITQPAPTDYIAFPKAFKILHSRIHASPEEIAIWVWLGRKNGGLSAYRNVFADSPEEFYFDHLQGKNYMAPLMGCWFFHEDITRFTPTERFMSGKVLIERWADRSGLDPVALIEAKISESRLADYHPTMGGTRGSHPGDKSFPPLEAGVFSLLEVQEIEKTDLASESDVTVLEPDKVSKEWWQRHGRKAVNKRHDQPGGSRDKQHRIRVLWATGKYRSREECANKEAENLGMSVTTARKALRNTPKLKT